MINKNTYYVNDTMLRQKTIPNLQNWIDDGNLKAVNCYVTEMIPKNTVSRLMISKCNLRIFAENKTKRYVMYSFYK